MTDLKNMSVDEIRKWYTCDGAQNVVHVEAFDEMARRLREQEQKLLTQDHAIGNVFGCMDAWRTNPQACAEDCPYCGLPAAEQAKCSHGFPGCMRADDQQLSKHFADAYALEQTEKDLLACQAREAELWETLQFYANGEHWEWNDRQMETRVLLDVGTKAANALSNLPASVEKYRKSVEAVIAMAEDGWLAHGPEGMSEAQTKCYEAFRAIKERT